MAENQQRDKRRGSLALRLAGISILFLVVPLIVYSIVGYRTVYRTQLRHVLVAMDLLEQGQRGVMDEFIKAQKQVLDLMVADLEGETIDSVVLTQYHSLLGQHEMSQSLFFLENGICIASSNPKFIGEDFTTTLSNRKRLKGGHDIFTAKDFFGSGRTLVIGKATPRGYLMLSFPIDRLLETYAVIDEDEYPINFSLLNDYNEVVGSSDRPFDNQIFGEGGIRMIPIEAEKTFKFKDKINAFTFQLDGADWAGILKPVGASGYQLLLAINTDFAFISFTRFLWIFFVFFGALVLVGCPLVYFCTRRLARPLRSLSETMQKVGEGKTYYRYEIDRFGYEINHAGIIFNEMIDTLLKSQKRGEEQRVLKETLEKEFSIGQEVQQSLIPETLPEISGLKMAARYVPAKEVGGDFYDIFKRADGCYLIVMADISGKGIHACFYALLLRSMLRSFAAKNADLKEVISDTNNLFSLDTGSSGVFGSAWVGIYDANSYALTHLNCGHPPAFLLRAGGNMEELANRTISLGVSPIEEFPVETTELQPGDQLFLYTDGLSETHNLKKELFGEAHIKEFLSSRKDHSISDLIGDLFEELAWFSEGAPQHDDLSFLVIRRASEKNPQADPEAAQDPQSPH